MINPIARQRKTQLSVVQITLIAAIGGFLLGFDASVLASTQLYFTQFFSLSASQQGWAISSAGYGCFVGAVSSGYLTLALSRKYTLILAAFLFVVSSIGSGGANSLDELAFFRIIFGLGIGMIAMTAPMYIAEISPPEIRGKMVTYHQLAMVIGFLIPFVISLSINSAGIITASDWVAYGWRLMLWSELIPSLVFLVLLLLVPHSPRWLMLKGRTKQAQAVLLQLTASKNDAQSELEDIANSLAEKTLPTHKLLLNKGLVLALFIGIMLAIFQQATGIGALLIYSADIFQQALNYSPAEALKPQLWVGVVNLLFTFVAIYSVDSWGRKPLLITGAVGMFSGLMVLAVAIYTQQLGLVSVFGVLLFVAAFAMSMGPVVWVILAEMFPNNVRSLAMAIVIGSQCLVSALVTNVFPILSKSEFNTLNFNGALPYFLFALVCIIAILFVWRLVPETKGKTLEEMEQLWH